MNPSLTAQSNRLPASHVSALQNIENGYWWFEGRVFWASQMACLQVQSPQPYMDLGCGTGGFAASFMKNVPVTKAALIDGDDKLLKIANKVSGAEIHQMDLTKPFTLPWTPSVVTCMDVIEHLPNDTWFLTELGKQMHKDGILIVSVPALPALFSEWDRQLGHFRRYTAPSLRKAIVDSGFEILRLNYFWSFLTPAAVWRKFRPVDPESLEFDVVNAFTNGVLKTLSRMEWTAAKWISPPLGTSLMAMARKK